MSVICKLGVFLIFSRGCNKLLINVFIITFRFYISYMEPRFSVAKLIGLPGSSAVNTCNIFRNGPVNDVFRH